MARANPEKVNPSMARAAMPKATIRTHLYTEYILIHYKATGSLAPGCDAKDLYAWYELNMPDELEAITRSKQESDKDARGQVRLE